MTDNLDSAAVAHFLADNPQFFARHATLLGQVKLSSPLTGKTVSLQERQMEVMRAKYQALELQLGNLTRLAQKNGAIAEKFHGWNQALLQARHGADLPRALVDGLCAQFGVPQATLRLWDLAPGHDDAWFAQDVSEDARIFANSLLAPYCGSNHDFEAVRWLGDAGAVQSTVILPLRSGGAAFGLLILGSADPARFEADMATDFLIHIGETASAALAALRA
ncbi:DUF484 family protein [Massilia psychrophila]|uniref:DUF484 domain-containing protein n=1 Tax=Massilia psychrophila TaxID=1603353 RepID=A0A2G8SXP4_9BURK|nr:DUF484 family protein [Massilia psychrophila]PIL38566.1 hypothetical protein CR103_17290 [Massilia psychrophila]GGE86306.1 hypothetical protein GCM10008020_34020 [Massilia psychrophila]